jgi:hypothetical protein
LTILVLSLSFCGRAFAIGECGAQFLNMGVGARACGMGEAFTSIADDATAIYWNPAGLGKLEHIEVLAMQNFWLLDMSYQYAALAVPTRVGAFGLAGAYSSSGTIPKYENFLKTGEYAAYDAVATIAYGLDILRSGGGSSGAESRMFQSPGMIGRPSDEWELRPSGEPASSGSSGSSVYLGLGLGGKFIKQKIENEDAMGFAGDAGLLCRLGLFSIGLAVQNIGTGVKFIDQADPLPMNIKAGMAARFGPVLLAVDVYKPRDNGYRVNVGAEGVILNVLALRAGYCTANSFTAGGGVTWKTVSVDYAFVPYKVIDATHRISVGVRF